MGLGNDLWFLGPILAVAPSQLVLLSVNLQGLGAAGTGDLPGSGLSVRHRKVGV